MARIDEFSDSNATPMNTTTPGGYLNLISKMKKKTTNLLEIPTALKNRRQSNAAVVTRPPLAPKIEVAP